jgi:hypothetical protein
MNEHKPRLLWPILTAVIVALILYVLSVGPACRQFRIGPGEIRASPWLVYPYFPVFWLMDHGPPRVRRALRDYAQWWIS